MAALERGFRRIAIVLSALLLAAGIAIDAMILVPHASVRVTLTNGRQETLDVHWTTQYVTDRESLAREVSRRPDPIDPHFFPDVEATEIKEVTVLRGPEYWWWTDSQGAKLAGVLVTVLWVTFFAVRWIARGFSGA